MTSKEFATFAAALKTYYPRENLLPNEQAMTLWFRQLQDIPYHIAEIALNKWVATNKWSPSIAEIRQQAMVVRLGENSLWADGWQEVQNAISKFGLPGEKEALMSMSTITREAVKRLNFRELCMSTNPTVDRANFRMIYEQIAERQRTERQMPVSLTNQIESVRADQMLIEGKEESWH